MKIQFVVSTVALALASSSAFAQTRTICRNPKDHRYIIKASEDEKGAKQIEVIRFNKDSTMTTLDTFSGRYLPFFNEGTRSINYTASTSHEEIKVLSDGEVFGTDGDAEDASWYGRVYLNGKIQSLIQGDDAQPVESPFAAECYYDI